MISKYCCKVCAEYVRMYLSDIQDLKAGDLKNNDQRWEDLRVEIEEGKDLSLWMYP